MDEDEGGGAGIEDGEGIGISYLASGSNASDPPSRCGFIRCTYIVDASPQERIVDPSGDIEATRVLSMSIELSTILRTHCGLQAQRASNSPHAHIAIHA